MRPPRFARDFSELELLGLQAKEWACPHCGRIGRVNRHGSLCGCGEGNAGKSAARGRRFLCSNRGRRGGCGRTFSIVLAAIIAKASVRSGELWRFYLAKLSGGSVVSAWAGLRSVFSLEAAYGWWRRWLRGQFALREILCRGHDPPQGEVAAALAAAYGADAAVASFQLKEQCHWP
jgi:hypothetical protein